MKKIMKYLLITLIVAFIGLYFAYQNGYMEKRNHEEKELTDQMIMEYEEDLKKGIDVTSKNYTVIKPSYANIYSNSFLKISKKIEKGFDKVIKYFFNKISNEINN